MKRIISIFTILMFIAQPVFATKQFLVGGTSNATGTGIEHSSFPGANAAGNASWNTAEISRTTLISVAGTLSNLRVELDGSVSAGDTRTFTVFLNLSASSLACTITDASSQACTDTGELSISAGDILSLQSTQTGTCCQHDSSWSLLFDSTDTGATALIGGSADDTAVSSSDHFRITGSSNGDTSSVDASIIFPLAGTLRNFYVKSEDTIGEGNTLVLTINDSADMSTGITCTLTNAGGYNCNDASNTKAVTAGDIFYLAIATTGTANTHGALYFGIELTATTEGQFGVYHSGDNATAPSTTEYAWTQQTDASWGASTGPDNQVSQGTAVFQAAYVDWTGTNGSGDTIVFTLETDGGGGFADSDIAITLSEGEQTGNDSGTVNAGDDEGLRLKYVSGANDSNGDVRYSFRAFIDPGTAATGLDIRGGTGGIEFRGGTSGIDLRG